MAKKNVSVIAKENFLANQEADFYASDEFYYTIKRSNLLNFRDSRKRVVHFESTSYYLQVVILCVRLTYRVAFKKQRPKNFSHSGRNRYKIIFGSN